MKKVTIIDGNQSTVVEFENDNITLDDVCSRFPGRNFKIERAQYVIRLNGTTVGPTQDLTTTPVPDNSRVVATPRNIAGAAA